MSEKEKKKESLGEFIESMLGNSDVVIASRNGVIYNGKLIKVEKGFLYLRDAEIRGSKYSALVSDVLIDIHMVQHIHTKPKEIIKRE